MRVKGYGVVCEVARNFWEAWTSEVLRNIFAGTLSPAFQRGKKPRRTPRAY
jgi:hypothetical protein